MWGSARGWDIKDYTAHGDPYPYCWIVVTWLESSTSSSSSDCIPACSEPRSVATGIISDGRE